MIRAVVMGYAARCALQQRRAVQNKLRPEAVPADVSGSAEAFGIAIECHGSDGGMPTVQHTERGSDNESAAVVAEASETLHAVLATQARGRTTIELWTGATVGVANATFVWLRFPGLHWLAAGLAATACYGAWGLIDRAMIVTHAPDDHELLRTLMPAARLAAGTLGWLCALYSAVVFLNAALGGLSLPGR